MANKNKSVSLLNVSCNIDNGKYTVRLHKNSNVNEAAFCVSVLIKCLMRDKVIKDCKEFTDLIVKYVNDAQYEEVQK